jgi:hypothetical protein
MKHDRTKFARREFLKLAGAAGVSRLSPGALAAGTVGVALILDAGIEAALSEPAKRAAERLRQAIVAKGSSCEIVHSAEDAGSASFCVVVSADRAPLARGFPSGAAPRAQGSLRLSPGRMNQTPAVLVSAPDPSGFAYGLLELSERVQFGADPLAALDLGGVIEEKPANEVRGVGRYFASEMEDKPWYYNKAFWAGYLDRLVASRFNRFTLAYGLEYDFPRGVTDDYFHFVYPYLVEVPGYPDVRVIELAAPDGMRLETPVPLSREERDRNFGMLRYIGAETGARGLHFQLGIWTHAYQWTDSPNAYHRIEGLTPENHARYCRDALAILLKECPQISGLTLRVHGESGIPEGSYSFWKTLFEAIPRVGREIEVDMHAKGVDQTMIEIATATGMPVKLGAKYSAEHQSLGYQQADIRALEIPHADLTKTESSPFRLSSGSRSFTRYGYADFLRQGTGYRLLFRLWPGTQRHLLSVDPETIAGYARTASFCGAAGLDLMEPLTFKGREGSGVPGGRCAYADASLSPEADWEKYEYYYRVWGRKLYDPDAGPEVWRRYLRSEFGSGAESTEAALASASRILALLTSAHLDSASNHDLWYEMPTNMPILLGSEPSPYGDTPMPKCFGTVSPLDPQMFSTVAEYTNALVAGQSGPKYSPIDVAQWVEDCVDAASSALDLARRTARSPDAPAFRRIEEDVLIQVGVGTFFALKLRSAVLFEIFESTGDPEAARLAAEHYQEAREAWVAMAHRASRMYLPNVTYGDIPKRRGHWSDRIPGIDSDLAAMRARVTSGSALTASRQATSEAIRAARGHPSRPIVPCAHTPPGRFRPGQELILSLDIPRLADSSAPNSVRLDYRHVNQAERWMTVEASGEGARYTAVIPAAYTRSEYPLQYYFVLGNGRDGAWMYPGFKKTLSNQPYFVVSHEGT